jgi:hypothetical protein
MIGEYWLMTWMLGLGLSPVEAISALVAARVAILLPIPGGLGALEASQAFAMSSLGFGPAAGISMVVLIRSRDLLLALVGVWIGGVQIWQRVATHRSPGPPQAGTHATHPPSLPYENASSATNDDATFSYDVS